MSEVRVTSSTGGQKGTKPAQLAWAPPDAMLELAKVYGFGAEKYDAHNFRKGYELSLTLNALYRHVLAFQGGEDVDPESGLSHMAHAAWHCLNAIQTLKDHPEFDDRYQAEPKLYDLSDPTEVEAWERSQGAYTGVHPEVQQTWNDAPDIEGRDIEPMPLIAARTPFGENQCRECGRYNWHRPTCSLPKVRAGQVLREHRVGG